MMRSKGASIVTAIVKIGGRDVALYGHDFTVRAGSMDATNGRKLAIMDDLTGLYNRRHFGVLMFLDCPTALAKLADLMAHVRPGGVAVVNVLVEGTTFADMFDPSGHCLLSRDEIAELVEHPQRPAREPGGRRDLFGDASLRGQETL